MIQTTKIQLSGLTCNACEKIVSKRLKTITGVKDVSISAQTGLAVITSIDLIDVSAIRNVLEDTHYKVINIF